MNNQSHSPARKLLLTFILIGCLARFCFGAANSPVVHAQAGDPTATPGPVSPYFTSTTRIIKDGRQIEGIIIHGPPQPPAGYARPSVSLPFDVSAQGVVTLSVPAFNWSFGCSATSGSMIASYYDRNGYPNIYTGPTNGGVMPLDSSSWPTWTDGAGATYGQCPLTASHSELDGRSTPGSIDDYWVAYLSKVQDPFITNGWTQHTWGDAIGDYMKTSQSNYGNVDGSTVFYNWTSGTTPLTCNDMVNNGITVDGTYGRKLFYEAKGYTVTDCYNQRTDNNKGGFTFAMFKAEIDAGRPVMLNLAGHTIVGVGYDSASNTVYLHDTWDYLTHSMTWGGSYSGMQLQSVSIVNLVPVNSYALTVRKSGTGSGTVTSSPAGIACGSTCSYPFAFNTVVTLTGVPSTGSTFTGWSGLCNGTGTCAVTMDAVKSVTANFTLSTYTLTVSKGGSGSGTVTSNPAGISCGSTCSASFNYNTKVTLTATASTGSTFTGWSGVCTDTGACTVTMTTAKSVTANFTTAKCYSLSFSVSPAGSGTISVDTSPNCGGNKYYSGTVVKLTGVPNSGYTFSRWSGSATGTNNPVSVTMNGNKNVTATFRKK